MGSFEREVTLSNTVDKTYIGDHTIKMKAHVGSLGNQSPFQHVLRDHLGSVDTLMDAKTGAVLQHRGYDVFGRPRDIASGNALLSSWQGVTKGYTDHEHLVDQELIHMNGRIYDFNVGRFLSVDPFLQFPENSQSANPYSYILNNPMSGVDPTGYRSEELDEVISGKAFEKLEKDESGNLYVTADGETYKLTSVSNGEKNFSISFDGNGGGTAQVGKTTGTVSLHKGNSSTSGKSWNKSEASSIADKYGEGTGSPELESAIASLDSDPNDLGQTAHVGRAQERNMLESIEEGSYLRVTGDAAAEAVMIAAPIPMLGAGKAGYQIYKASRATKGLITPEKFFGGLTHKQAEKVLMRKFGSPRGGGSSNKSFFNSKTKRTYNLHQDPLHRGGKPHIDIRKRGLPTNYYKDKPFFLNGGAP